MKREAFKMYLKPGYEAEYEKRHAAIWPELKALLSKNGVSDYSIYWDKETNILFAFQKTEGEGGSQDLGNTEIVQRRRVLARYGSQSDCAEMVGLYGRYHEGESGQFTGFNTIAGSLSYGLEPLDRIDIRGMFD